MPYTYKITAWGIKLDLDSCPPELGYRLFPNANWRAVTVDPVEKCYEFLFDDKQEVAFESEFITVTESEVLPPPEPAPQEETPAEPEPTEPSL